MTITIDIPAISELAAAINNLAAATCSKNTIHREALAAMTAEALGADDPPAGPQPVTAEGAPAKRTRRTKAEMGAERKAIEETKGRRVDDTPQPGMPPPQAVEYVPTEREIAEAKAAGGVTADTGFQWTLEKLKDTFLSLPSGDVTDEMKAADDAKRVALKAIREAIAPEAQNLSTMDEKHYAEFAKRATAWYREQGLELTLPGGCEL